MNSNKIRKSNDDAKAINAYHVTTEIERSYYLYLMFFISIFSITLTRFIFRGWLSLKISRVCDNLPSRN